MGDNVKYEFSAHQLSETRKGINCVYYKWPLQLAEKTWIGIEAFIDVFERALTIHEGKYEPPFDRAMFERTVALARERVGRRGARRATADHYRTMPAVEPTAAVGWEEDELP